MGSGVWCQVSELIELKPRVKLHYAAGAASAAKILCQGTRFARTLTYTMMRILDTIGDPDSVLCNHRAAGVHHRRASSWIPYLINLVGQVAP